MHPSAAPILVIDSGLGGLTVVRQMQKLLPAESILYFGDTARLPYGSKTVETVTLFVRQIIRSLLPLGPKHIVIACNTASALALPTLRQEFAPLSITGVIEPGARAAVAAAGNKPAPVIGVIATEATVRSRAYTQAIRGRRVHAKVLLRSTPLLVPAIEEGRNSDDPVIKLLIAQYLAPLLKHLPDVLVLGCTHYPIIKRAIIAAAGEGVAVIDSARQCAEDVARRLATAKMLASTDARPPVERLRVFVSDDPQRFGRLASRFLGYEVLTPTLVTPETLHAAAVRPPLRMPA